MLELDALRGHLSLMLLRPLADCVAVEIGLPVREAETNATDVALEALGTTWLHVESPEFTAV
jgi:hypothetical protein